MLLILQKRVSFLFNQLCILMLTGLLLSVPSKADVDVKQLPEIPKYLIYVNDYTNTLTASEVEQLEVLAKTINNKQQIKLVVAIVESTGNYQISEYAFALMNKWYIRKNPNDASGVLFLIAIKDRKAFIATGQQIEGYLPDSILSTIQRRYLIPAFKENSYFLGIKQTIEQIDQTISQQFDSLNSGSSFETNAAKIANNDAGIDWAGVIFFTIFFFVFTSIIFPVLAGKITKWSKGRISLSRPDSNNNAKNSQNNNNYSESKHDFNNPFAKGYYYDNERQTGSSQTDKTNGSKSRTKKRGYWLEILLVVLYSISDIFGNKGNQGRGGWSNSDGFGSSRGSGGFNNSGGFGGSGGGSSSRGGGAGSSW